MLYFKQNLQGSYYNNLKIKHLASMVYGQLDIFHLQISLSSIYILLIRNVVIAYH